jgi:acyl carrier protein
MSDIETAIRAEICDSLGVKEDDIKLESSLIDDLGADSLDQVELVMALEERFDIEIDDVQMESIRTVGELVAIVEKLKA